MDEEAQRIALEMSLGMLKDFMRMWEIELAFIRQEISYQQYLVPHARRFLAEYEKVMVQKMISVEGPIELLELELMWLGPREEK